MMMTMIKTTSIEKTPLLIYILKLFGIHNPVRADLGKYLNLDLKQRCTVTCGPFFSIFYYYYQLLYRSGKGC